MTTTSLIVAYLLIGIGFWMGAAVSRLETFKNSTVIGIIRGLILGILVWPVAFVFIAILKMEELDIP